MIQPIPMTELAWSKNMQCLHRLLHAVQQHGLDQVVGVAKPRNDEVSGVEGRSTRNARAGPCRMFPRLAGFLLVR